MGAPGSFQLWVCPSLRRYARIQWCYGLALGSNRPWPNSHLPRDQKLTGLSQFKRRLPGGPAPPLQAAHPILGPSISQPYHSGHGSQLARSPTISVPGPAWTPCCPAAGLPDLGPLWPVGTVPFSCGVCGCMTEVGQDEKGGPRDGGGWLWCQGLGSHGAEGFLRRGPPTGY